MAPRTRASLPLAVGVRGGPAPHEQRRAVVGVIGHVDHGKTALVRALTGIETDRLAEERQRGISIALGFAHLSDERAQVDLIDMPGHERFVRTMIAGATGIDAVLLVVDANEGIMPQTREHVAIAGLLGIAHAVVAVTKCDLVDAEQARFVGAQAAELLRESGCLPLLFGGGRGGWCLPSGPASGGEAPPPTPSAEEEGASYALTSTHMEAGIADLREGLLTLAARAEPRPADGRVWLPIDRAFSIPGHGPVVTGTLRGAPVRVGDTLMLHPAERTVRVRGVQVHGESVAAASPGQRTALNLRDVERGGLARGMALAAPDWLAASEWLSLTLRAVAAAPPLANGARLRALFGTSEVDARLRLLDRDVLEPGEMCLAQIRLAEPAAVPARAHVVLRLASPAATVAGGVVLEPAGKRRRRRDSGGLARLAMLRDLAPERLVAAEVEGGDTTLVKLGELTALSPARIGALLAALPVVVTRNGAVLREAELVRLAEQLPPLIAGAPLGLSHRQLAALLPGTRAAALDEALSRLVAADTLARRGSQFVMPDVAADAARAQDEAALAERIAGHLALAGLTPPLPGAIVTDAARARAVERLLRAGTIVRAVDRAKRKELLFHADAIAEAKRLLAPVLVEYQEQGGLLVSEIMGVLGISRKFAMPLLDHLDTVRFTRRVGDRRMGWADVGVRPSTSSG